MTGYILFATHHILFATLCMLHSTFCLLQEINLSLFSLFVFFFFSFFFCCCFVLLLLLLFGEAGGGGGLHAVNYIIIRPSVEKKRQLLINAKSAAIVECFSPTPPHPNTHTHTLPGSLIFRGRLNFRGDKNISDGKTKKETNNL